MNCSSLFLFVAVGFSSLLLNGLPQDEAPRQLWDSQFLKKRAPAKTPTGTTRKPTYRRATPKADAAVSDATRSDVPKSEKQDEATSGEVIGLTIWRLRQSRDADNKEARLLIEEDASKTEFTPERVESETNFSAGDRVRLSIESPRDGYLYVINREQYADGTMSDPYLIFPTLRNRGGDNSVKAGKVIELPGKGAFRLTPMRPDYQGEVLMLIVSPQPLEEIKAGPSIVKLDRQMVDSWQMKWKAPIERYELNGGAGTPYTKAEKEAGEDGSRLLTQEDELPQTLFKVTAKPGNALFIPISLKITSK
jgi:hypothetical protein